MDTPLCPLCDGTSYMLGQLGPYTWFRCRCCGYEHYEE
jgi:tRNA(Ile2) C34 agmatinyltransferase TiaS